jgi:hypothetical protein
MKLLELDGILLGYLYAIGCGSNDDIENKFNCSYHYDDRHVSASHLLFKSDADITMFLMKLPSRDEMKKVINAQYTVSTLQSIGRALRKSLSEVVMVDYL